MTVRNLEDGDIDIFVALANAAGWSYEAADAERLLRLFPGGFFASEEDGVPKGFATAMAFGATGIIGNVVVDSRHRRVGVGRALTNACIQHLKGAGATDIRLYSYEGVVPFYERLGFHKGDAFVTMSGKAGITCRGHGIVNVDDKLAKEIHSLDARLFRADRTRMLKSLRGEFPELALASVDGDAVEGYLYARGSERTGYEAGPWASKGGQGLVLMDALLGKVEAGSEVWVSIPEANRTACSAVGRLGFRPLFKTMEMAYGSKPVPLDERMLALCGLEKG
ncbi:MAG: GNAT family N-acetyltransferase [Methanobacteriota archaeon]